ncbi:MAG TPA: hypothetical protein VMD09_13705 [Solirubrobacteraceae bacterium]|nr:hypothetical protein [Solirubrobacteraceae bacterium]
MSWLRRDSPDRQASATHDHAADPPVAGGGRELISNRERHHRAHARQLGRFRWAVGGLFALAVASLVVAVVLSGGTQRATSSGGAWSAWSPPDDGLAGAQEIADYIAPYYRASAASQLAVVTVVNLNNPANPTQVVVPSGSSSQSLLPLPAGSTVVYNLCGVGGSNCSIGVGKPSSARLLLLRREALELALYTFKYVTGAQTVVAILPPGHTEQTACTGICAKPQSKPVVQSVTLAVAFDKPELEPYLAEPLRATLPEELPPTVAAMPTASEAPLVSVITGRGLFSEKTQSGQDGSTVITLSPMPPQ